MKTFYSNFILKSLPSLIPLLLAAGCQQPSGVTTYPAIPDLVTSDLYQVTANGEEIWTEKFRTDMDIESLPDWFTSEPYTQEQQEVHLAQFSCSGSVTINIRLLEPGGEVSIHPESRDLEVIQDDQGFSFTLPGPDKLYIRVGDQPPLCLFANPEEKDPPSPEDPGIRYFGPGVHRPGMMELQDNETVYIAGGAIVYGGIRTNGANNIRVTGRGILDGNFEHQRMVMPENSDHLLFEGIMIRNGRSWTNTIVNCTNVIYKNIKVISFGPGGDGINPLGSEHVTIDSCFLRCTDDCIAIKSPDSTRVVRDVRVTNNTMIGFAFSDGITIGFETNGPVIEDVEVRNCDILQARGGSRVEGHSAFSIICDGPAIIRDILYENIRVEEPVLKLFELHITDGTKYGINPPGHIRNIHLKNVTWASERPIILQGFDESHRVSDVLFENCTVDGVKLIDTAYPEFRVNEFVDDVRFK